MPGTNSVIVPLYPTCELSRLVDEVACMPTGGLKALGQP